MNNRKTNVVSRLREKQLASASSLFEVGELSDEISDESFILRINTIFSGRFCDRPNKAPANLADAISNTGKLTTYAELVAFGRWMLLDQQPGMEQRGGVQANQRLILKCVAVAMYELQIVPALRSLGLAEAGRNSRKREITKRDLAHRWEKVLGEKKDASSFDALLRSLQRFLPAYLLYLKSGSCVIKEKQIRSSPMIKKVLEATTANGKPLSKAKSVFRSQPMEGEPALLSPLDFQLRYSSSEQEEEYRGSGVSSLTPTKLQYLSRKVVSTSPSERFRKGRKNKIVLEPEISIRENYKVTALIDRMVVLVNTTKRTDYREIREKIAKHMNAIVFVQDLTNTVGGHDWGAPLPIPGLSTQTGYHFAIMIQDPTRDQLRAILGSIKDDPGIESTIRPHLVEVSIDFYPSASKTRVEAIQCREQMVGLLQRHHWCQNQLFFDSGRAKPSDIDARQIYKASNPSGHEDSKTRYLFSHGMPDGTNADHWLDIPDVRQRILTQKPGENLYLNSTVLKGAKNGSTQVSIQHKIANRRHREKNSMEILDTDARRARIEVTISGTENLSKRGLTDIDDLGTISFRKLTKPFLTFRLATSEPWKHLLEDAQAQMKTRGVYGIELRTRALALEEREKKRERGERLPRMNNREGHGLQNWEEMNDVVGKSLDELQRRWRGFAIR